jgi:phage tail protein X
MITAQSRYASSVISVIDHPTRGSVLSVEPRPAETRVFNFTYIVMEEFDRVDLIAYRVFGNAALWWKVADANPEILDWSEVEPGTVIRVPSA